MPAHGLRPRLRAPSARTALVAAAVLAVVSLAYLAARETSLFALERVEVTGGRPGVRASVRDAAQVFVGESLVALDGDDIRRRLEAIPSVRSVEVDRAFPHTLRITATPERPLAVLVREKEAWLVSARGRVIRPLRPQAVARRPRVEVGPETPLAAGEIVAADDVRLALAALRRIPADLPARVDEARVDDGEVTLVLAGGDLELRLGEGADLPLKLAVAARVLRTMPAAERDLLGYLDVTMPERPVGGPKAQVSSKG